MTAPTPSRITLADLIPLIEAANLSPLQKRDCLSAVRTVARLLGAEPAAIAADPPSLRRRLDDIAPEAMGVSRGRWNNVRSLFAKALALARPMLPGRSAQPISPDWERLSSGLPFNRRVRLLPLLRFLSSRGADPDGVNLEDLHAYRDAIIADRLRKNPEQTWDSLVWSWNACRREVDGWPAVRFPARCAVKFTRCRGRRFRRR